MRKYSDQRENRVLYLDILKAIAIIAMILLHVSAVGLSEASVGSFDWHIANIYNSICRFCVPVFIMISGSIFLNREVSMKKYIMRLLSALVFWTIMYILYASLPKFKSNEVEVYSFIKSLTSPTHLWFLWMILCLYLSVPILRQIVRNKNSLEYFLILWIIFGLIIPALHYLPVIGDLLVSIVNQMHFYLVLEYSGYFVLGYYLSNLTNSKIEKYSLIYILVGFVTTVIGTYLVSASKGQTSELFLGYLFPTTFLTSAGIFIYFKNNADSWKIPPRLLKIISIISVCSLGIYAIHMFYLVAFHKIGLTYALYNPIISIPTICAVTLIISIISASCIKRFIPGGKKLI